MFHSYLEPVGQKYHNTFNFHFLGVLGIIFGIMGLFTIQGVEKIDWESERKLSFERNVKRKLFDNWKEATRGN